MRSIFRAFLARLEQFQRLCWAYKGWFEIIWASFVAFPPLIIANQFTNEPFSKEFSKDWPWIAAELAKAPIQWTLIAGVWVLLTTFGHRVGAGLLRKSSSAWIKAPGQMLAALDDVVARKTDRFERLFKQFEQEAKTTRRRRGGPGSTAGAPAVSSARIFEHITKPEAQIDRLAEAIYATFDSLTRHADDQIEQTVLTLALVRRGNVETIFSCLPSAHQLRVNAAQELSRTESCLMQSVRTGRMQVVQSTFDERERPGGYYIDIGDGTDQKDGSTICFPVPLCESGSVIVISIYYPRRDAYLRKHYEIYEGVLARFAYRLRLEYSLLVLKGLCK